MVSVIIVNYNAKKFISHCILSIKSYAANDTEIIVVDNNSTDGSIEKLRKKRSKSSILIESQENEGYAKAVNRGIKIAKGDYIFILNPDTQVTKDSIKNLLDFAEKNKYVGIVGPKLLNSDGSLQASAYHESSLSSAFKEYFLGVEGAFQKYAPEGDEPVLVDAVVGAAMFIPRKVIEKVGFFDERYFMYFEDLDYCRRARRAGFSVYYLPSSQIYHEHGGVTQTVGEKAKLWLVESSKIYHGVVNHTLLTVILWLGQKWRKIIS